MKTHIIWFCVSAAALLVGTQFARKVTVVVEKPVEVVKTKEVIVEKPVDVIREVPKEVEKIVEKRVEVPAKIPEKYETALALADRFAASELVSAEDSLAGVKAVRVSIAIGDDIKRIVSEDDIRTKFEITLRRSGVSIDEASLFAVVYSQDGFFTRGAPIIAWSSKTNLMELVWAFRPAGRMIYLDAPTWSKGQYGTVGEANAREWLIKTAESDAEGFANEWLAKNPKK